MIQKEEPAQFVAAPPVLRNQTANAMKVLRLVKAGDPYRDKGRGKPGRTARLKTIEALREQGLVRVTGDGFLRVTARGKELLVANPPKR
jgi:hypothetical protein